MDPVLFDRFTDYFCEIGSKEQALGRVEFSNLVGIISTSNDER